MWQTLDHPAPTELYEQLHALRGTEDWMPMVRAVRHLQSLPVASSFHAFTSLWRFHVTTAPSYQECESHCSVTILWQVAERRFHMAFGRLADGWLDDRPPEQICDESSFASVVEPFLQRLAASKESSSESPTRPPR